MRPIEEPSVAAVFARVPAPIRSRALAIRELILATDGVGDIAESLKWGEPSYRAPRGTTVRIGWKPSDPNTIRLLFHCTTRLVETFRDVYPDYLRLEDNRAIVLDGNAPLPSPVIARCVACALSYHDRKHLPLLGLDRTEPRAAR